MISAGVVSITPETPVELVYSISASRMPVVSIEGDIQLSLTSNVVASTIKKAIYNSSDNILVIN